MTGGEPPLPPSRLSYNHPWQPRPYRRRGGGPSGPPPSSGMWPNPPGPGPLPASLPGSGQGPGQGGPVLGPHGVGPAAAHLGSSVGGGGGHARRRRGGSPPPMSFRSRHSRGPSHGKHFRSPNAPPPQPLPPPPPPPPLGPALIPASGPPMHPAAQYHHHAPLLPSQARPMPSQPMPLPLPSPHPSIPGGGFSRGLTPGPPPPPPGNLHMLASVPGGLTHPSRLRSPPRSPLRRPVDGAFRPDMPDHPMGYVRGEYAHHRHAPNSRLGENGLLHSQPLPPPPLPPPPMYHGVDMSGAPPGGHAPPDMMHPYRGEPGAIYRNDMPSMRDDINMGGDRRGVGGLDGGLTGRGEGGAPYGHSHWSRPGGKIHKPKMKKRRFPPHTTNALHVAAQHVVSDGFMQRDGHRDIPSAIGDRGELIPRTDTVSPVPPSVGVGGLHAPPGGMDGRPGPGGKNLRGGMGGNVQMQPRMPRHKRDDGLGHGLRHGMGISMPGKGGVRQGTSGASSRSPSDHGGRPSRIASPSMKSHVGDLLNVGGVDGRPGSAGPGADMHVRGIRSGRPSLMSMSADIGPQLGAGPRASQSRSMDNQNPQQMPGMRPMNLRDAAHARGSMSSRGFSHGGKGAEMHTNNIGGMKIWRPDPLNGGGTHSFHRTISKTSEGYSTGYYRGSRAWRSQTIGVHGQPSGAGSDGNVGLHGKLGDGVRMGRGRDGSLDRGPGVFPEGPGKPMGLPRVGRSQPMSSPRAPPAAWTNTDGEAKRPLSSPLRGDSNSAPVSIHTGASVQHYSAPPSANVSSLKGPNSEVGVVKTSANLGSCRSDGVVRKATMGLGLRSVPWRDVIAPPIAARQHGKVGDCEPMRKEVNGATSPNGASVRPVSPGVGCTKQAEVISSDAQTKPNSSKIDCGLTTPKNDTSVKKNDVDEKKLSRKSAVDERKVEGLAVAKEVRASDGCAHNDMEGSSSARQGEPASKNAVAIANTKGKHGGNRAPLTDDETNTDKTPSDKKEACHVKPAAKRDNQGVVREVEGEQDKKGMDCGKLPQQVTDEVKQDHANRVTDMPRQGVKVVKTMALSSKREGSKNATASDVPKGHKRDASALTSGAGLVATSTGRSTTPKRPRRHSGDVSNAKPDSAATLETKEIVPSARTKHVPSAKIIPGPPNAINKETAVTATVDSTRNDTTGSNKKVERFANGTHLTNSVPGEDTCCYEKVAEPSHYSEASKGDSDDTTAKVFNQRNNCSLLESTSKQMEASVSGVRETSVTPSKVKVSDKDGPMKASLQAGSDQNDQEGLLSSAPVAVKGSNTISPVSMAVPALSLLLTSPRIRARSSGIEGTLNSTTLIRETTSPVPVAKTTLMCSIVPNESEKRTSLLEMIHEIEGKIVKIERSIGNEKADCGRAGSGVVETGNTEHGRSDVLVNGAGGNSVTKMVNMGSDTKAIEGVDVSHPIAKVVRKTRWIGAKRSRHPVHCNLRLVVTQNQCKAAAASANLRGLCHDGETGLDAPLVQRPTVAEISNEKMEHITKEIARRRKADGEEQRRLSREYLAMRHTWTERLKQSREKRSKEKRDSMRDRDRYVLLSTRGQSALLTSRTSSGRTSTKIVPSLSGNGLANGSAELDAMLADIEAEGGTPGARESWGRTLATIPEQRTGQEAFDCSSVLMENPIWELHSSRCVNPWMVHEKVIFLEKFLSYPKNFAKIAGFLEHKSTQECVRFYFDNKLDLGIKQLVKEASTLRRKGMLRAQIVKIARKRPSCETGVVTTIRNGVLEKTQGGKAVDMYAEDREVQLVDASRGVRAGELQKGVGMVDERRENVGYATKVRERWMNDWRGVDLSGIEHGGFMGAFRKHGTDWKAVQLMLVGSVDAEGVTTGQLREYYRKHWRRIDAEVVTKLVAAKRGKGSGRSGGQDKDRRRSGGGVAGGGAIVKGGGASASGGKMGSKGTVKGTGKGTIESFGPGKDKNDKNKNKDDGQKGGGAREGAGGGGASGVEVDTIVVPVNCSSDESGEAEEKKLMVGTGGSAVGGNTKDGCRTAAVDGGDGGSGGGGGIGDSGGEGTR